MTVRVRYAPSPTGHLHVGSLRTALYNWLFARRHGGSYLLRIEDTDLERSRSEYTASILSALQWASLEADEAPVIQSQRLAEHIQVAQRLLAEGKAYKCYCTPAELVERLGASAAEEGSYTRYDQFCLEKEDTGNSKPYAIRFKIPHIDRIEFTDLIRGPISFNREQLDDFIIVRSDGMPMYNFVVVVDDAFMKISHVLRGEDHISNTPKQVLLYEACGFVLPQFAHFSLILGADGQRLSKRHSATSVSEFMHEGYLADALCNYLVRLGWSHGDQELFTRDELVNLFSLEQMHKAGAIFDIAKLGWMNSMYIRALSDEAICSVIMKDVDPSFKDSVTNWSNSTLNGFISLYKERVKTVKELSDVLKAVHQRPQSYPEEVSDASLLNDHLTAVCEALIQSTDHSFEGLDTLLKELCKERGLSIKELFQPLRIALTGNSSSPGVSKLIELLTVDESVQRIEVYQDFLKRNMKH